VNGLTLYAVLTLLPLRAWTPLIVSWSRPRRSTSSTSPSARSAAEVPAPGHDRRCSSSRSTRCSTPATSAFTNYGTGNVLTQEQAVDRIISDSITVPRTRPLPVDTPGRPNEDGELALLLTDPDGDLFLGTEDGLTELDRGDVVGEGAVASRSSTSTGR
jgi:hypothetical protein